MSIQKTSSLLVRAAMLFLLFTGSIATTHAAPSGQSSSDRLVWAQVGGVPSTVNLTSVSMLDPATAWAAGDDGQSGFAYRLNWLGDHWEASPQGSFPTPIRSVVALSAEEAWAVADGGVIEHRTANGWQLADFRMPNASFQTITMAPDGREGFVAGFIPAADANHQPKPVLVYYHDGVWTNDTAIPGTGAIRDVSFMPSQGLTVAGDHLWRYAGNKWAQETEPPLCGGNEICPFSFTGTQMTSADEAWAVGSSIGMCAICVSQPYIVHRMGGAWHISVSGDYQPGVAAGWAGPWPRHNGSGLADVAFSDASTGLAVGWEYPVNAPMRPVVLGYSNNRWSYANLSQVEGSLSAVDMADATHALTVGAKGLVLAYGYGAQPVVGPNVTERVANPNDPNVAYFDQTGHTLRGGFRSYWQQHGGLAQFGYPLSEEFSENGYTVQFFERARLEYHPENQPPYNVLLGLLGHTITAGREGEAPFQRAAQQPNRLYSPETGHNIAPEFATYWQQHGGLPVYGYPISEAFTEVNPADGKTYLVQYFERNRFEYHPELSAAYTVSLGLLGTEVLRLHHWLP